MERMKLLPSCMIGPSEPCEAFQSLCDRVAELEKALKSVIENDDNMHTIDEAIDILNNCH